MRAEGGCELRTFRASLAPEKSRAKPTKFGPCLSAEGPQLATALAPTPGAYLRGLTNFRVKRSLSPMAAYFSRSLSPSANVGGNVHTPRG